MLEPETAGSEEAGQPEEASLDAFSRLLLRVCEAWAVIGGVIMIALITMSVVSIVGRKLFATIVPGDLEVLQMGTAVAVAAFLPYCQARDRHLRVDFFTIKMSRRKRALLDAFGAILLAATSALIAWRTAVAAIDSYHSGEVSLMLGWPTWYAIAGIVPSFVLLTLGGADVARWKLQICRGGSHPGGGAAHGHQGSKLELHSAQGSRS